MAFQFSNAFSRMIKTSRHSVIPSTNLLWEQPMKLSSTLTNGGVRGSSCLRPMSPQCLNTMTKKTSMVDFQCGAHSEGIQAEWGLYSTCQNTQRGLRR